MNMGKRNPIEAAIQTLRAGRRERLMNGPDWFCIRKGSRIAGLDGQFTREELLAVITLLDSGQSYETFERPFADDATTVEPPAQ